ncbi:GNAT family N-acetyltransferase [Candidatus Woesearchaeota archaeon]|nr:GNAT family N-acetyltransferase [Candidatus Woesearchaeota archaeon]
MDLELPWDTLIVKDALTRGIDTIGLDVPCQVTVTDPYHDWFKIYISFDGSSNLSLRRSRMKMDLFQGISTMEIDSYKLDETLQGYGYGRRILELSEQVALRMGCLTSIVPISINDSFWEHMGYEPGRFGKYTKNLTA